MVCMCEYGKYLGCMEVIESLKKEIEDKFDVYRSDLLSSKADMESQMKLFEDNRNYDVGICDTLLLALCNSFHVEIVVAEMTSRLEQEIKYVHHPTNSSDGSQSKKTLYMLKTGNHFDSLVGSGKSSFVLSVF